MDLMDYYFWVRVQLRLFWVRLQMAWSLLMGRIPNRVSASFINKVLRASGSFWYVNVQIPFEDATTEVDYIIADATEVPISSFIHKTPDDLDMHVLGFIFDTESDAQEAINRIYNTLFLVPVKENSKKDTDWELVATENPIYKGKKGKKKLATRPVEIDCWHISGL